MVAATASELGYFVRGTAPLFAASNALDTAQVREGVINNLDHLCDCEGQVLVNLHGVSAAWTDTDPSDAGYKRFPALPSMVVPLRIRHDGASHHLVVQLRCSAAVAGTVSFLVVARPYPFSAISIPDPTLATFAAEVTTTSTTGADLSPDPLYLTSGYIAGHWGTAGLSPLRDYDSTDGAGDVATVSELRVSIEVWAKTSLKAAHPRIHSLMVREFIGAVP